MTGQTALGLPVCPHVIRDCEVLSTDGRTYTMQCECGQVIIDRPRPAARRNPPPRVAKSGKLW